MFVLKSVVAFLMLCLVSSVIAHPLRLPQGVQRRHMRARAAGNGRCRPRPTTTSVVLSTSAAATEVPANTLAPVSSTPDATPTPELTTISSSAHAASTHTPDASSTHAASTHTSSSAAATPTKITVNKNFAAFAPVNALESWSTSPAAPEPLPLQDSTFRTTHVMSALAHPYVDAPDGQRSMKATYPQGSYNFQHEPLGGFSVYAYGPSDVDLTTAKEVTFGYSVFFEDGFDFNIGGKLPGVFGGNSEEVAFSCSGGRRSDECFSSRLMWRTDGKGEIYTYLPPSFGANDAVCSVAPQSECNPTYGASVGRGAFHFVAGQSNAVSMRVRLNDVGQQNGEIELWTNGESVISVGGLVLRNSDAGRIRGLMLQTFFGGSSQDFASPKDQSSYFRDFTVAITEKL